MLYLYNGVRMGIVWCPHMNYPKYVYGMLKPVMCLTNMSIQHGLRMQPEY